MLFIAALAGGGDAGAEIVSADTPPEPISVEAEGADGPPALDATPPFPQLEAPFYTIAAPHERAPGALSRELDRSAQALLRELYLADKEAGLDAYMAELRTQALGLPRPGSAAAPAACSGPACGPQGSLPRLERSIEDQRLLESLIDFRADVREVFTPLQTIYQDSGLKTLLETARSDDLVFGSGRSGPDAIAERGFYDGRADGSVSGRRESSTEVLALIRFVGNFWQIMRDFGIPIILLLIAVRGMFWIAKARRA